MKNSLICITPINQINGLKEKFKKSFKFYYKPDISKNQLISKKNKFDIIFTNPPFGTKMKYEDLEVPEKSPVYSEYYFEYTSLKKIMKKMNIKTSGEGKK